jgi:PPOX class probable F420-dependent enzyme
MGVRLTDEEVWEFLATAHTGIFTTLRRDGTPVALPMRFVALDRAVYLRTLAASKKAARIRRDPRVAFLAESGLRWAELKAVHLNGVTERVTDPAEEARVAEALEVKYGAYRTARQDQPEATRRHYSQESVVFRI